MRTSELAIGIALTALSVCAVLILVQANRLNTPAAVAPVVIIATPRELCVSGLKSFVDFKDPDSVKVGAVDPASLHKDTWLMLVNAKNGYGGYIGDSVFACKLDETHRKVLSIGPFDPLGMV